MDYLKEVAEFIRGRVQPIESFYFDDYFLEVLGSMINMRSNQDELVQICLGAITFPKYRVFSLGLCLVNTDEANPLFTMHLLINYDNFPDGLTIEFIIEFDNRDTWNEYHFREIPLTIKC